LQPGEDGVVLGPALVRAVLAEVDHPPAAVSPAPAADPDLSVNGQLAALRRYGRHPDGTPTNEPPQFRLTFTLLRKPSGFTVSVR
jgi:hypothetical protein